MAAENIDVFLKEKRLKNKKFNWQKIKLYGLPILTLFIFISIVLFLILPRIGDIFFELGNIESLNVTFQQKQALLSESRRLQKNLNELQADLSILDLIAPSGNTEVLAFRNSIQTSAEKNGLSSKFQVGNDTNIEDTIINESNELTLKEIAIQFEVSGSFDQIELFIDSLNNIDDFIIIKEMALDGVFEINDLQTEPIPQASSWSLRLTIAKYQFNQESENLRKAYRSIDPSLQLEKAIQEYVRSKR